LAKIVEWGKNKKAKTTLSGTLRLISKCLPEGVIEEGGVEETPANIFKIIKFKLKFSFKIEGKSITFQNKHR
jgi:hypothetical protein